MGLLSKVKEALKKTSSNIALAITGKKVDDNLIRELEEALILADVGVENAEKLVSEFSQKKFEKETTETDIRNILKANIESLLKPYQKDLFDNFHSPEIVLIIGVNGNGKTTTVAKLANLLKRSGYSPLLVAGDTFRAAAVAQLEYWTNKLNLDIFKGAENSDAAGVVYSAIEKAQKDQHDVVLIDTAGRMQNRSDLIDELKKIKRVIKKLDPEAPHSTVLVLDGFTGQAAQAQVETFLNEIGIDSIIMTKLDATAKGGAIVAITQKYNIPVSYIGVGEGIDDIQLFDAHQYAQALIG